MEGHFNRSYSYMYSKQNGKVLPVILYLTLPTVNLIQNSKETTRKTRSQKQKQRDQERMKHEQKTVCSLFPFSSLDNNEIQKMVTQPVLNNFANAKSKTENNKLRELQTENQKLNLLVAALTNDLKTANEKLKHKESIHMDLKEKLVMEQNKSAKLEIEYSELKSEFCEVKGQYKEKTEELETYTEQTQKQIDEDLEYHVLVENHLRRETNVLRNEIEVLKMELSQYTANTAQTKHFHGTTGDSFEIQISAHQGIDTDTGNRPSGKKCQQRLKSVRTEQEPGCNKCGHMVRHQPSQCPARNFLCEKCSKRGHHTFNCFRICSTCGGNRLSCYNPRDCTARNLTCPYCNVKGHLENICLQKRYDEIGF